MSKYHFAATPATAPATAAISDLRAITTFLALHGETVDLFEPCTLINSLVNTGHVICTIPVLKRVQALSAQRGDEYAREYVGALDVHSFNEILQAVHRSQPTARVELEQVPRYALDEVAIGRQRDHAQMQSLLELSEPSICCIGGLLVSSLPEIMISRMFEVKPFHRTSILHHARRLPLSFTWGSQDNRELLKSQLLRTVQDLADSGLEVGTDVLETIRMNRANAIVVDDHVFAARFREEAYSDYGIVVAQRRDKQLWVVVAGLSGPGTYAASCQLENIALRDNVDLSRPTYAVVKASVSRGGGDFDSRIVKKSEIIIGPKEWNG